MDLRSRWPQIDTLCRIASSLDGLQLWIFGSALRAEIPRDLDVLLLYVDRASVVTIRSAHAWEECDPPCDIIAMTSSEEREYQFIKNTEAVRLV
jgi:hypothetical protein